MNNSKLKSIVKSKGFVYGIAHKKEVVLIRPNDSRVQYLTPTILGWLDRFNDKVEPEEELPGYYVGDRVQVFSPDFNYRYWSQFGVIKNVYSNGNIRMVTVHVEIGEGKDVDIIDVLTNEVTVLERKSVVNLHGMSMEERDLVIAQMTGITKENKDKSEYCYSCECQEHCGRYIDTGDFEYLNSHRVGDNDGRYILCRECESLRNNRHEVTHFSNGAVLVHWLQVDKRL